MPDSSWHRRLPHLERHTRDEAFSLQLAPVSLLLLYLLRLCWALGAAQAVLKWRRAGRGCSPVGGTGIAEFLLLRSSGSGARGPQEYGPWALERRLGSCGSRAQWLQGTWGLPASRMEPRSPALAGGFFNTEPQGSPAPSFPRQSLNTFLHLD